MQAKFRSIVSSDSHVLEPVELWWNALGQRFGDRTPRVIYNYRGHEGKFFYAGGVVGGVAGTGSAPAEHGYVPEARVKFQQEAGIAAEVVNPTRMLSILLSMNKNKDYEMARACAGVYNDWIAEFTSYNPKRLVGVPVIPMHDINWAIQELKRTVKKGLRGGAFINVRLPEGCPPYRDRAYDAFWATAQDLEMPITLHPFTGRIDIPYLYPYATAEEKEEGPGTHHVIYNEVQVTLANDFIFGTILDRFPGLKIICSEYEVSWVPLFMFRIDHQQRILNTFLSLPKLSTKASDFVRSRVWHGFIEDPHVVHNLRLIGADQILWGSDYPHPIAIGLEAQGHLAGLLGELPREDQEKVVGGNAAKVFGL